MDRQKMKILFEHSLPFSLAHGGVQIQIEQTKSALEKAGVEVEFLRWWDDSQQCDIIQFFGRPGMAVVRFAQQKGIKVVLSDLLTAQGSRSKTAHRLHGLALRLAGRFLPPALAGGLSSICYQTVDFCLALTPWEAHLMKSVYGASPDKVRVVPNGVEQVFFETSPMKRADWLVCTATITERKRILELATGSVAADVPLRIIGKPYAESDPYHQEFLSLVRANPTLLRYEGGIEDRAQLASIYRQARGFVLLSAMESLSLSALEAAACECPLLLSDLPWARGTFSGTASYCPVTPSVAQTAHALRTFYDAAPIMHKPSQPLTWNEVAHQLKSIYEDLLKTSR
jgi:glycosyltransferase involved in cell wall biosynthesis